VHGEVGVVVAGRLAPTDATDALHLGHQVADFEGLVDVVGLGGIHLPIDDEAAPEILHEHRLVQRIGIRQRAVGKQILQRHRVDVALQFLRFLAQHGGHAHGGGRGRLVKAAGNAHGLGDGLTFLAGLELVQPATERAAYVLILGRLPTGQFGADQHGALVADGNRSDQRHLQIRLHDVHLAFGLGEDITADKVVAFIQGQLAQLAQAAAGLQAGDGDFGEVGLAVARVTDRLEILFAGGRGGAGGGTQGARSGEGDGESPSVPHVAGSLCWEFHLGAAASGGPPRGGGVAGHHKGQRVTGKTTPGRAPWFRRCNVINSVIVSRGRRA